MVCDQSVNDDSHEETLEDSIPNVSVLPTLTKGKLSASVTSPFGDVINCNISKADQGTYVVQFIPHEIGDHIVSVFLNGQHVPGSPFAKSITGLDSDPSKIIMYGAGLKGGLIGTPATFTVSTLNAGSGALSISINGPAKAKINCVEQFDGTHKVTYNTSCPGTYDINVYFADQHVPGSPHKVYIAATEEEMDPLSIGSDPNKCTSHGIGLQMAVVGEAASFTVVASDAGRGSIMVGIQGYGCPAEGIIVKHVGGNVYEVTYVVVKAGDYILHVLWDGKHIRGSPYHLNAYSKYPFESSL